MDASDVDDVDGGEIEHHGAEKRKGKMAICKFGRRWWGIAPEAVLQRNVRGEDGVRMSGNLP